MDSRVLLYCEQEHHARALRPLFLHLQLEIIELSHDVSAWVAIPACTLAVVVTGLRSVELFLGELRRLRLASKTLALVPLEMQGQEARLAARGADDVLSFPVSRARLELTLRNLLRLHLLEQAILASATA